METKYQMRIRRDLAGNDLAESASELLGACEVSEIRTLTVALPSIQDVLAKMAEIEELNGFEIISIVLIDVDNSDILDGDFDLGGVE